MLSHARVHGAQHTADDHTQHADDQNDGNEPPDGHGHPTACLRLLLRCVPGAAPRETGSEISKRGHIGLDSTLDILE